MGRHFQSTQMVHFVKMLSDTDLCSSVLVEELLEGPGLDPEVELEHVGGHLLPRVLQHLHQAARVLRVELGEEGVSDTLLAGTACPPDSEGGAN